MDRLPEELIDNVISRLDTTNLARLCLVSKQLHRIVEPHLYRSICINFSITLKANIGHRHAPINQLLRTLRLRPQLWAYVRRMSAPCASTINDVPIQLHAECEPTVDDAIISSTFLQPSHGLRFFVIESLPKMSGEWKFHNFEGIKMLDIGFSFDNESGWFAVLSLPDIHVLYLRHGFEATMVSKTYSEDEWLRLRSSVKILHLDGIDQELNPSNTTLLQRISTSCPSLISLRVLSMGLSILDARVEEFRAIVDIFSNHLLRGHLRDLELWESYMKRPRRSRRNAAKYVQTETFAQVRAHGILEQLDVDARVLLEKTTDGAVYLDLTLPRTLRDLTLRMAPLTQHERKNILRALKDLVKSDYRTILPTLQTICLLYDVHMYIPIESPNHFLEGPEKASLQELADTFNALGIGFEYKFTNYTWRLKNGSRKYEPAYRYY